MNRRQFIVAMIVPAAVMVAFLGVNLFTLTSGEEILLKVAPVDPRDLFRGDYVALTYEISRINLDTVPQDALFLPGETVYAVLSKKEKFWTIDSISHTKPSTGRGQVFMKGRVTNASEHVVVVEWGIESYFVPEGQGIIIEGMRNAEEISVVVVVDSRGSSVLKQLLIDGVPV